MSDVTTTETLLPGSELPEFCEWPVEYWTRGGRLAWRRCGHCGPCLETQHRLADERDRKAELAARGAAG